jgi:hypothetical protein
MNPLFILYSSSIHPLFKSSIHPLFILSSIHCRFAPIHRRFPDSSPIHPRFILNCSSIHPSRVLLHSPQFNVNGSSIDPLFILNSVYSPSIHPVASSIHVLILDSSSILPRYILCSSSLHPLHPLCIHASLYASSIHPIFIL